MVGGLVATIQKWLNDGGVVRVGGAKEKSTAAWGLVLCKVTKRDEMQTTKRKCVHLLFVGVIPSGGKATRDVNVLHM